MKRTVGVLLLLAIVFMFLPACGGGGGGFTPTGSSNWDTMKWDQDDWA